MRKLLLPAIALLAATAFCQSSYYDVTAGNGNGVRFWQSDAYKIHMGSGSEYFFGPVTDYSIKTNMNPGSPNRGWTWGVQGQAPIAAINAEGHLQVAGRIVGSSGLYFTQSGTASDGLPYARLSEAWGIRFNSPDNRWVFSSKPTVLIGYQPAGQDWGSDNLLVAGRVGIGTTSPEETLHIGGSVRGNISGALRISTGNGYIDIGPQNASWTHFGTDRQRYYFNKQIYVDEGIVSSYDEDLTLQTEGNTRVTISAATGNVGIGNTSPTAKLDVSGGIVAKSNSGNQYSIQSQAWRWDFDVDPGNGNDFRLRNMTSGTVPLAVTTGGNIGIGTSTPDYKLTVKGKIHAEEVKVDLSVPGPDYVFEPDYHLTPLQELKSYINEHKHLPEVPSAKEMEANGINLMEMNVLLLKKVEELTLHVIRQQQEIEKQKAQNEIQSVVIEDLKNLITSSAKKP